MVERSQGSDSTVTLSAQASECFVAMEPGVSSSCDVRVRVRLHRGPCRKVAGKLAAVEQELISSFSICNIIIVATTYYFVVSL
jgi:hypothetical protein